MAKVRYNVRFENPSSHFFSVTMELELDSLQPVSVSIPVWSPGSYMVRDYSTFLHQFRVESPESESHIMEDLHTWKIFPKSKKLVLSYTIFAFEEHSVRTNYVHSEFAFLQPTASFLYPRDIPVESISLQIEPSSYFRQIYTALEKSNTDGEYIATDYDSFFDSPIWVTNQVSHHFKVGNCNHELVWEGNIPTELRTKLVNDLERIVSYEIGAMENNPNEYYLFVIDSSQKGYGGLEHKSCSINHFDPNRLDEPEEYAKLLELLAHEYFHLWNGKRLRPIALGPFDYQNPNLTKELWFVEGVTSFYDKFFILKTGFLTPSQYLKQIMDEIQTLEENSGEDWMSLEESSFTAWTKYYKKTLVSNNVSISYYNKGALLVLSMDLWIRYHSNLENSFLDLLKALYGKYSDSNPGYRTEDIFRVAKETLGLDLFAEFYGHIHTREKFPIDQYLSLMGVERIRSQPTAHLGIQLKETDDHKIIVTKIHSKGPAMHSGLQLRDEVLGFGDQRIHLEYFHKWLKTKKEGETISLLVSSFGKLKTIPIPVGEKFAENSLQFSVNSLTPLEERVKNQFFFSNI